MEEKELVKRLKQKEPGAFKELVELHQDRVLNTCYRFLFNREDSEDAAQEVFITVHHSLSSFKETASLSTWLYRIAVNRSIDLIRKKKRKKRFAPVKSLLGLEEEGKEVPAPEDENPQENLEQLERMDILQGAIDALPDNQRIAFTLGKCDGMGNKEIANIMELSLASVESLMHRAKRNLRKKLYGYFEKDLKRNRTLMLFLFFYIILSLQRASFSWLSRLKG
jgi:RNA polymerase sigma-70 factor (ECF subfamily)